MQGAHATTPPTDTTKPPRILGGSGAQLLAAVRALIVISHELLDSLADGATQFSKFALFRRFSTLDLTLIVARVRRALLLAAALEKRLVRGGSRIGQYRPVSRPRAAARPRSPGQPAKPRRTRDWMFHFDAVTDDATLLAGLPTAQDIAERIRRQPIGRVLQDICMDLGIDAGHELWPLLYQAITYRGGNIPYMFRVHGSRLASRQQELMAAYDEDDAARRGDPEEPKAEPAETPPPPLVLRLAPPVSPPLAPPLPPLGPRRDGTPQPSWRHPPPITGTPPPLSQVA